MSPPLFADTEKGVPNWLFNESSGVHVVGIPGSGKSNFLLFLTKMVAEAENYPIILIDPAGDTAKAARDLIWDLSPSARKRLYYIRPADEDTTVCLNPLSVERASHLSARVSYCNHILLTAWGATDFNQTPRLAKWSTLAVKALALHGLPLCYTLDVLDPTSPVHAPLVDSLDDSVVRRELQKLRRYEPKEWDEQVGSSLNRWMGFFDNPIVQAILSQSDGLDMRTLQEERAIVLINLERGGTLREEDQEIIANLYLSELLYAVYNTTTPTDRIPTFLLIDELPMFRSSFGQLTDALKQVRKFLLRMVCCHQGVYSLPDGPKNPLLNNLMNCKTQFFFQLINTADTEFFGAQLAQAEFQTDAVKHILKQDQFYTAGHDIINLSAETENSPTMKGTGGGVGETGDESETWNVGYGTDEKVAITHNEGATETDAASHARNEQRSRGSTEAEGFTETKNPEAIRQMISQANNKASGRTASEAEGTQDATSHSNAKTKSDGVSTEKGQSQQRGFGGVRRRGRNSNATWSLNEGTGRSFGYRQTLFPIIKSREIIASIQFLTPEEQKLLKAKALAHLDVGTGFMYVGGKAIVRVPVPEMVNPYQNAPLTGKWERQACLTFIHSRPEFLETRTLTDLRYRFHDYLKSMMKRLDPPARDLPIAKPPADSPFDF